MKDATEVIDSMGRMKFFGGDWGAAVCRECPETQTPVGVPCFHCHEAIARGDCGFVLSGGSVCHKNCLIRNVVGSVGHQTGQCRCFRTHGVFVEDPPSLTLREAADAAANLFMACASFETVPALYAPLTALEGYAS